MSIPVEMTGIFQGDLVIRSAIMAGIEELRANPDLLDWAFAGLDKDALTRSEYGKRESDNARRWFLNTKIAVFMSTITNSPDFPAISITQMDSNEAETTLADLHYVVQVDDDRAWPALTQPFDPVSYDQATGTLVLPASVTLILAPGQQVVDIRNRAHEILEVTADRTVLLAPGTVSDFAGSVIKGQRISGLVNLESVNMKESYSIGCHVQGEQVLLSYLHSLLVFILYRGKAGLLEARGFERSTVSSSDFRRNDGFENEYTFSRHLTLTGYVRQMWPAASAQKITATVVQPLVVLGLDRLPADTDPEDTAWAGEEDALTFRT